MATCAYCGTTGKCTREHILPRFLYDHVDVAALGGIDAWNESTQSRVGGQHAIKDVCPQCNNGPLSELDAYGKSFLRSNGLLAPLYVSSLTVEYDYHLLLRWLLKLVFNSARASSQADHPVAPLARYIAAGSGAPGSKHVFVLVELLKPYKHINIHLPRRSILASLTIED